MPSPLERLRAAITQRLQDHPVVVNVPERALPGIASSRELRSQFETGFSGGLYDPNTRSNVEEDLLGIGRGIDPRHRPVYGYVGDASTLLGQAGYFPVDGYGQYSLVLNPEVKDRSTFSIGDSLGYSRPFPMEPNAPRPFSLGVTDKELNQMLEYGEQTMEDGDYHGWDENRWKQVLDMGFSPWVFDYFESQVDRRRKPLTLSDVATTLGPGREPLFEDVPHLQLRTSEADRRLRELGVYAEGGRVDGR